MHIENCKKLTTLLASVVCRSTITKWVD